MVSREALLRQRTETEGEKAEGEGEEEDEDSEEEDVLANHTFRIMNSPMVVVGQ
ncbi:hypothetical protein KIPB_014847, partial [Kipferlia bialata]|eukprot:g14847.t1